MDKMTTNNDRADAIKLWEVMGEVEGLRPDNVSIGYEAEGFVQWWHINGADIDPTDTLFILTGHAERWLENRGWMTGAFWGTYWHPKVTHMRAFDSLAEAIRAEAQRQEQPNDSD